MALTKGQSDLLNRFDLTTDLSLAKVRLAVHASSMLAISFISMLEMR